MPFHCRNLILKNLNKKNRTLKYPFKEIRLNIWLLATCALTFPHIVQGSQKAPSDIRQEIWNEVYPYLMRDDHPIKARLDEIFSDDTIFSNIETMTAAGFIDLRPQKDKIFVAKHPKLNGYVIKAYLDSHTSKTQEYTFWIKRIKGSRYAKRAIDAHKMQHYFKIPKKWIYLLPKRQIDKHHRKNFILIAEDMDIEDSQNNENLWKSPKITKDLLKALFTIITEEGLADCVKPANCPFTKKGKIAFVDTIDYHKRDINYHTLTQFLSAPMQSYWEKLVKSKK